MTTIVLGCIHGVDIWKSIISSYTFDHLIFVGDYFDTTDDITPREQLQNFSEILSAKRELESRGKMVTLLIGNHDYHYMGYSRKIYLGYQHHSRPAINHMLMSNLEHLSMSHMTMDILITHAGVTNTWLRDNKYDEGTMIVQFINDLFRYKPKSFDFFGVDIYGDDVTQSPIWVRPNSLVHDAYKKNSVVQVVGHTRMSEIRNFKTYYFIDTLTTSCQHLRITDGKISII